MGMLFLLHTRILEKHISSILFELRKKLLRRVFLFVFHFSSLHYASILCIESWIFFANRRVSSHLSRASNNG